MGNCFYFRMVSGASLLSQAEDEWFLCPLLSTENLRQTAGRPLPPVRDKGGGQGREGQSVLALWEGEGVPSEKLFASPLKWDAPREEGGTSKRAAWRDWRGSARGGRAFLSLVGHPLRQQTYGSSFAVGRAQGRWWGSDGEQ